MVRFLLAFGLLLAACAGPPMSPPLTLTLYWDNGSVPPQYRKSGRATVDGDTLRIERWAGYEREPVSVEMRALSADEAAALVEGLRQRGAFETEWREPERLPVGGGGESVTLGMGGAETKIPREVTRDQREAKAAIMTWIRDSLEIR